MKNQEYRFGIARVMAIALGMLVTLPAFGAAPPSPTWGRTVTAGNAESGFSATAIDAAGNVYVAGGLRGSSSNPLEFGYGVTATSIVPNRWSLMLVKYDSSGIPRWAKSVAGTPADSYFAYNLAVDSAGNVYAVGYIGQGTYDFGNGVTAEGLYNYTVSAVRRGNGIVVKYNSSGTAQWARTVVACTDWSTFKSVAVDSSGNVYCVGNISKGVYNFGNGVSVTAGPDTDWSSVVLKYDSSGTVQWARTVPTGAGEKWMLLMNSIALDASGNLFVVGIIGSETFSFGNGVTVKGAIGLAALLVKYDANGMAQWAKSSTVGLEGYSDVAIDPAGNIYAVGSLGPNFTVRFGNQVTARVSGQYKSLLLVKYDSSGTAQ